MLGMITKTYVEHKTHTVAVARCQTSVGELFRSVEKTKGGIVDRVMMETLVAEV